MPDHTSRFNIVTQLSEKMLLSIIHELQNSGDFPSVLTGLRPLPAPPLGSQLDFSYEIDLGLPTLSTSSGSPTELALAFPFTGFLQLGAQILARPPVPASSHQAPVPFQGSVAARVTLNLARVGTYGYLELVTKDLETLTLQVQYDTAVGGNGPIFDRMIFRILLSMLRGISSIAVSHAFEMDTTTGWQITNNTLKIIDGGHPGDRNDVTVALNTWPNRFRGDPAGLADFVNPNSDLAICYDERLLVQAVAQALSDDRLPNVYNDKGCPTTDGPVKLTDIAINLGDGNIALFVQATMNGANFDARGVVTLHVDAGNVLRVDVTAETGSQDFLAGVAGVLTRALFAVANLETFADPNVGNRPAACRDRVMLSTLCGIPVSLVLKAPVPTTKVLLTYTIQQIDVTANEMCLFGQISTSHS